MKHLQFLTLIALFALKASAQNVGIGTPTPSDQLHTTGTVRFEKYKAPTTRMMQMDSSGRLAVTPAGAVFTYFSLAAAPDNCCAAGNGILSTITVAGQPLSVPSSNIAVRVNISHPWDSDLRIYLYPPTGGGVLVLASQNGADGDNFTNTLFTDQAAFSFTTGIAPFTGQYRPKGGATACLQTGIALANFAAIGGDNVAPNGDWILKVFEGGIGDVGSLNDWSISFTGTGSLATDGENNYLPKFSAGNLVPSSLYESEGNNYIGINKD